ncbi:16S rRNA (cytosine(1402)-N(4))-methyltransferase RsmH [Patescibacteria group bacterium]
MNKYHNPVLVNEVIEALKPSKNKVLIDATAGGGGHIKELTHAGSRVLGIDQDPDAINFIKTRQDFDQSQLTLVEGNFENIHQIAIDHKLDQVDGVLMDLGVSSHQFDTPERGFSFQHEAPLDMRMSPNLAVTARDLINGLGKKELYDLFTKYAQEKLARPIAQAIISARSVEPIESTKELARIVERVYGSKKSHLHPATKVFQALRMAVNDEINTLKTVLPQALRLLKKDGRLAIISFHEGEDRIVKQFFKSIEGEKYEILTKKPITPNRDELSKNIRSRSAKLRILQKNK